MMKRSFIWKALKFIFKLLGFFVIASLIIFILMYAFYSIDNYSETTIITTEEVCIVQDKHIKKDEESLIPIVSHYLDVSVHGYGERHSVLVTKEAYDTVHIGSEVKCEVTYNEHKVLNIIFSDLD